MPYKLWFKDSGKESSKDSGESSTALGIEEPERLYVCIHVFFCLVQIPFDSKCVYYVCTCNCICVCINDCLLEGKLKG